jgi:hypothetical protein
MVVAFVDDLQTLRIEMRAERGFNAGFDGHF